MLLARPRLICGVKVGFAQLNPTVGDFTGNLEKIVTVTRRAADRGARLAVFSELAICGYPPADFLEKPAGQTAWRSMFSGGGSVILCTASRTFR